MYSVYFSVRWNPGWDTTKVCWAEEFAAFFWKSKTFCANVSTDGPAIRCKNHRFMLRLLLSLYMWRAAKTKCYCAYFLRSLVLRPFGVGWQPCRSFFFSHCNPYVWPSRQKRLVGGPKNALFFSFFFLFLFGGGKKRWTHAIPLLRTWYVVFVLLCWPLTSIKATGVTARDFRFTLRIHPLKKDDQRAAKAVKNSRSNQCPGAPGSTVG